MIRGALSIASVKQKIKDNKILATNPITGIVLAIGESAVNYSPIKELYNLANEFGITEDKITIVNVKYQ